MEVWHQVIGELEAKGIRTGPESFQWWNDGDAGFVRAIWCLTRHLRPKNVVETGVAHGVTSRFILEALKRNGDGHLWSIDLPPLERFWRGEIGIAVGSGHSDRWTYIRGSSRRRLPGLLRERGQIDLFVHDSRHSERNVRFELDRIWPTLGPKGAVVVDDIDANWGFQSFTQTIPDQQSLICEAEPLRPDLRRFNKKGLFGIILKKSNCKNIILVIAILVELKRDTQHFDFEWPEQLHDPALSKSKSKSYACAVRSLRARLQSWPRSVLRFRQHAYGRGVPRPRGWGGQYSYPPPRRSLRGRKKWSDAISTRADRVPIGFSSIASRVGLVGLQLCSWPPSWPGCAQPPPRRWEHAAPHAHAVAAVAEHR